MNSKVNKLKLYSYDLLKNNQEILEKRQMCNINDIFENIDDYNNFSFQFKFKDKFKYLNS